MKEGSVGTYRHRVGIKKRARSGEGARSDPQTASWIDQTAYGEPQSGSRWGIHAQQCAQCRATRIEELRARINAGTYTIDSRTLAERLLKGSTRLMDEQEG